LDPGGPVGLASWTWQPRRLLVGLGLMDPAVPVDPVVRVVWGTPAAAV